MVIINLLTDVNHVCSMFDIIILLILLDFFIFISYFVRVSDRPTGAPKTWRPLRHGSDGLIR